MKIYKLEEINHPEQEPKFFNYRPTAKDIRKYALKMCYHEFWDYDDDNLKKYFKFSKIKVKTK